MKARDKWSGAVVSVDPSTAAQLYTGQWEVLEDEAKKAPAKKTTASPKK